ncbi:unnamed protein product, partial [Heterotrigona itama]
SSGEIRLSRRLRNRGWLCLVSGPRVDIARYEQDYRAREYLYNEAHEFQLKAYRKPKTGTISTVTMAVKIISFNYAPRKAFMNPARVSGHRGAVV